MWILPKQLHTSAYVQDTKGLGLDSEEFSQISERSLMWRSKPSLSRTWLQRWKRNSWIQRLSSRILKPSHTNSFVERWTLCPLVFPASHSALLESVKQLKIQGTCSHSLLKESESANLELFSERTYKESLVAKPLTENQFSNMSSESWNKWVTKQRQEYSQRKKLALLTKENESSSWATPRAGNPGSRPNGKGGKVLAEQAQQSWPTASVAGCVEGGVAKDVEMTPSGFKATRENGTSYGAKLRDAVIHHEEKNWATPQVTDTRTDVRMPSERSAKAKKGGCKNLREEVMQPQNWPTPTTAEGHKIGNQANYGQKGLSNHPSIVGEPTRDKGIKDGKQKNWPTARARDWKDTPGCAPNKNDVSLAQKVYGLQDPAKPNTNGKSQGSPKLNPNWVEQLMGLPVGWTQLPTEWTD